MATDGAPFSIREYAARARAEGGSWPFGGEVGALPPMEVPRFRWWADEVAAVEAEEGEVERRMAAKRRKRSVAELFAAVPRVVRGQGCGRGKTAKRKLDAKENGKGKRVLAVRLKASKGFKKEEVPIGIIVREKEKSGGVKATLISISQVFQDSISKKKLKKSLSKKRRNQEVPVLLIKKSKKGNRKSVLDSHKKSITNSVQAQSILKKHSKAGFSTLQDNTDVRSISNSSCKSKHVAVSDGDNIFEQTAHLPEGNSEQPRSVQTTQQPSQEGHYHLNKDEPQLVYQRTDAISAAVQEYTSSLSENVASAGVYHTVPLTKPKDRTVLGKSVDLNSCMEISNSSNCLNSISLACLSSKVPCQNFNGVDSRLNDDEGLSLDVVCLGEEHHMLPQGSSNPFSLAVKAISGARRSLSQPSSSYLNDRSRNTFQERLIANCPLGKVLPKLLRSGKDVVRSISSSTGSNKSADVRATDCRSMHFSDDYVGLPLNSRGEFVKVHPGGTLNTVDILKRQCLGENSSCSAFSTASTPRTRTDHVNLRPNHHVPQFYTADQSVFHPDPRFTPATPTAYGTDVRLLPSSERMRCHRYIISSNKYPCTNQQELSAECFCSGCMGHHNPKQQLLGMQNCCLSQNREQNTQHTVETTMRLMGKTVTLGTSAIQCRGLYETPCSSKQTRVEDQLFQGTHTEVFPQLLHGGLVDPPPAFRISNGERQPSGNTSYFSFVPAAEPSFGFHTNSFRTNGHNQQSELAAANNLYAQSVSWCNEGELRHQQPVMAKQVQSNAEGMLLLGSLQSRHTQTIAPESSFNRNSVRNFMEKRTAPYQSNYLAQQFGNMAQRTPVSSFLSGYGDKSTPGLTTQTKFTSLPPLPPSVIPSQAYSADYAQPHGSTTFHPAVPHGSTTTFHPAIPVPYLASKSSAPGNKILRDERMKWIMMASELEGLEHMRRNCKRPAEKDDMFVALAKKPCMAVQKDLNMSPLPERGTEFCGSRPDVQPGGMPVFLSNEPEAYLRLGNKEARATLLDPVNTARPVKLKPGEKHILQPSSSSMGPVHSVTPFAVAAQNDAYPLGTSKTRDTESTNSNPSWF